MATLGITNATTTDLKNQVQDFSVNSETPDETESNKETFYDYPEASEHLGYYKTIPELKKAIDSLSVWVTGKGYSANSRNSAILDNLRGWGEDSAQSILWNMQGQKKIFGDAFAEIMRNEKGDTINLKPLYTGNMRVVVGKNGLIKRYEQRAGNIITKFRTDQILHMVNDRIANEIHGTSIIDAVKWVIDARNEALEDERAIRHRDRAMGILEVDTDNKTKLNTIKTQYQNAVKNGEVLVLPKDVMELKEIPGKPGDRLAWIQYLENFFYQAVGIPRVIATSENFTEAASKVGYLTFEPIYTREMTEMEADLFNQTGIKLTFNKPPSLIGTVQDDEAKNTGQVGFQPNETKVTAGRNE